LEAAPTRTVRRKVIDPDGNTVTLSEEAWQHILEEHREMAKFEEKLASTLTHPMDRNPDVRPGRERYLAENVGPSRYLTVIVEYADNVGDVITAFGHRNLQ